MTKTVYSWGKFLNCTFRIKRSFLAIILRSLDDSFSMIHSFFFLKQRSGESDDYSAATTVEIGNSNNGRLSRNSCRDASNRKWFFFFEIIFH